MRIKSRSLVNLVMGLLLLRMGHGVLAQDGGDRQPITRDTVSQLALIGTLDRGWVNQLAWSSDGAYLAVAAENGTYIYDAAHWDIPPQALPSYGHIPSDVAWRAGTQELVTAHARNVLLRWGAVNGVFEQIPDIDITISNVLLSEKNAGDIRELAFTADGSIYVSLYTPSQTSTYPCEDCLCVYDILHSTCLPLNLANQRFVMLPDGTPFPLTDTVALSANGQFVAEVPPGSYAVNSRPTSYVMIEDAAGTQISQVETGFLIPPDSGNAPDRIALSPSGSSLAAAGCTELDESFFFCAQNGVRLFDVASGQMILNFEGRFRKNIQHLVFSPDGTKVAAADGRSVRVWDVASGEVQALVTGYGGPGYLFWHPTQPVLISANRDGINFWNSDSLVTGDPIASLPSGAPIAVSPDGKYLVAGNMGYYGRNFSMLAMTHPTLWNISDPTAPYAVTEMTDVTRSQQVVEVQFSPDGTLLAVSTDNYIHTDQAIHMYREIRIIETQTWSLVASTQEGRPFAPEFSPDGRWFTYWVDLNTEYVYPTASLRESENPFSEEPYLTFENAGLEFLPDSSEALLFVDDTQEVQRWDLEAKRQIGVEENRPFYAGTYSPDGSMVLIGDTIYDTNTYEALWSAGLDIGDAVFSTDGKYLFLTSGGSVTAQYVSPSIMIQVFAVPRSPQEIYTPLLLSYPVRCGSHAEVRVLEDDTLNVRDTTSLDGTVLAKLESGTIVDIVDEDVCLVYDGEYIWLHVQMADGVAGWSVMFADGLQTLVPVD